MEWIKKNLNPKGKITGDCVTRALAEVLDISWEEALKVQYEKALEMSLSLDDTKVADRILKERGFRVIGRVAGIKVETADKVVGNKTAILRTAHHLVACKRGYYIDSWDSGYKGVYKYWVKD